jgi:hypothetical protein
MKSGLVSIAISVASGASRSRIGLQKVPTPGPYSTKTLVRCQSTRPSILSISRADEGMIEPTITGCFRKPRKNIAHWPSPNNEVLRLPASALSPGDAVINSST